MVLAARLVQVGADRSVKVTFVGLVYGVDKSFLRHQYLLTSVKKNLL